MKKHVIFYSLLAIIILILSGFLINNVTKIDKMNIDYNTLQTEFSKIQKDLAETKALLADKDLELITIKAERYNLANNLTELQTKNNNLTTKRTKTYNTEMGLYKSIKKDLTYSDEIYILLKWARHVPKI